MKNLLYPYIKPTNTDAGYEHFKCFEVGYTTADGAIQYVIGNYSDHIWITDLFGPKMRHVNMDLLPNNIIRFHSPNGIKWTHEIGLGSMTFLAGWVDIGDFEAISRRSPLKKKRKSWLLNIVKDKQIDLLLSIIGYSTFAYGVIAIIQTLTS